MTKLVMRKREGKPGEIGLFVDSPVWEDDFAHIKMGAEVNVDATTPRSLRQLKFAWALATKIADGCDWVETKEDAMDAMLIEARHFRRIYDPLRGVAILKPKPTNFGAMDGTDYTRLLKRLVHVAVTIMIPGMNDADLIAEVEAMVGPDIQPEPKKSPARGGGGSKDRPPAQDPDKAGPRPAPSNEAEYIAAARSWIAKQTDHQKALEYLDGEAQVALRAACKLSVGANKSIHRELAEHFERMKNAQQDKSAAQVEG